MPPDSTSRPLFLSELSEEYIPAIAAAIHAATGITLTVRHGIATLKHEPSGACVMRRTNSYTVDGITRLAAHMIRCIPI